MHLLLRTVRSLVLVAVLLLVASCGDAPAELVSGQPGDDDSSQDVGQDGDDQDPVAPVEPPVSEYVRTVSSPEVVSATAATIDELVVTGDGSSLLVRFTNAAEPCALARAATTETESTVEVLLETGLNPNAAAMSCIAQVFAYEIETPLAAPVGDRELIAVPGAAVPPSGDPLEGAEFPTDQYLGLTQPEAEALGEVEQRVVRVGRIDDEMFGLTEDFIPTRVTIEIEAGIVVSATSG